VSDLNKHEQRKGDENGRGVARLYYSSHDGHGAILRVVFSR